MQHFQGGKALNGVDWCAQTLHKTMGGSKQSYKCAFHDEAKCLYRVMVVEEIDMERARKVWSIRIGIYGHTNHGSGILHKQSGAPAKYMKTRFTRSEHFVGVYPNDAVTFLKKTMRAELNSNRTLAVFVGLSEKQISKFKPWFSVTKGKAKDPQGPGLPSAATLGASMKSAHVAMNSSFRIEFLHRVRSCLCSISEYVNYSSPRVTIEIGWIG
jgi:hypothetical protein